MISMLVIHNQSLDDWEFLGAYNMLFVEVSFVEVGITERISDEVIKDFLVIIVFPRSILGKFRFLTLYLQPC